MGYHYIHNLGHFLQQKYFTQTITTHIVILERAKKSKEQLRMNSHVFEPRFAHRDPWFSLVHQASWGTLRAEVASMLNFFTTPTGLRSFLSGGSTTKELLRHHLQLSCTSWMCFPSSYKSKVKVCRENRALKKVILVSHWHPGRGPHILSVYHPITPWQAWETSYRFWGSEEYVPEISGWYPKSLHFNWKVFSFFEASWV